MAIFKPDPIIINIYDDYIDIPSAMAGGYMDDWEEGIAFCLYGTCTGKLTTNFGSFETSMFWSLNILKSYLIENYMKTRYVVNFSPELFELDNDIQLFENNEYFKKTIGHIMLIKDICPRDLKTNFNKPKLLM
jgi:hypothetical protein